MDINKVKRNGKEKRSIMVSLRITPSDSKWLSDNQISPSKLFNEALKELKDQNETAKRTRRNQK